MSRGSETKLEDTRGKYLRAIKEGQELKDVAWEDCRILLTDERLVLSAGDSLSIPLSDIDEIGDRLDLNQTIASENAYSTLHVDDDAWLVSTPNQEAFETDFYRSILDGSVVFAQHPAVVGGVVQASDWQRGRLKITKEAVRMVLEDGQKFVIDRDGIGGFETDERSVAGERRSVLEVEHTDDEDTSIQTYLSGREYHMSVLRQVLAEGAERNRATLDLDVTEKRVLMALYSGVSPFAISEFVGIETERVEKIYDRLIELDVIEVVRERKDVGLTSQGRKVAGEAMSDQ